MSVCLCVMEVECSGGRTRLVTCDFCTSLQHPNLTNSTKNARNAGQGLEPSRTAGAIADANGEQQLRSGSSS